MGSLSSLPRTPNFLDIVDDGVNGVSFLDGNEESLAKVLIFLCDSRQFCREVGKRAREKVEHRLNWRWNATEVCRVFAAAVAGDN